MTKATGHESPAPLSGVARSAKMEGTHASALVSIIRVASQTAQQIALDPRG